MPFPAESPFHGYAQQIACSHLCKDPLTGAELLIHMRAFPDEGSLHSFTKQPKAGNNPHQVYKSRTVLISLATKVEIPAVRGKVMPVI
jgi:hypothetical protein